MGYDVNDLECLQSTVVAIQLYNCTKKILIYVGESQGHRNPEETKWKEPDLSSTPATAMPKSQENPNTNEFQTTVKV